MEALFSNRDISGSSHRPSRSCRPRCCKTERGLSDQNFCRTERRPSRRLRFVRTLTWWWLQTCTKKKRKKPNSDVKVTLSGRIFALGKLVIKLQRAETTICVIQNMFSINTFCPRCWEKTFKTSLSHFCICKPVDTKNAATSNYRTWSGNQRANTQTSLALRKLSGRSGLIKNQSLLILQVFCSRNDKTQSYSVC